jgi:DNA polymerase-4
MYEYGCQLQEAVRQEVGLSVTVGLGTSRMVAKMASKSVKPDGLRAVRPGQEDAFIGGLPVEKLPGVGHATAPVLRRLNVQTIADLRALQLEQLVRLFGQSGRLLHERCRGRDTQAVTVREIPQSISRETSFHHDTIDRVEIEGMLGYLGERAVRAARQLGLKARTISARIRYASGGEGRGGEAVSRTLADPSDRDEEVYAAVQELLTKIYTRRESLHGVGVTLSNFVADSLGQLDLFDPDRGPRLDRLYKSLDHVRDRFGHSAVVTGKSIHLLGKVEQDGYGFVLRTPSLTK